jgi:hypothetical protein
MLLSQFDFCNNAMGHRPGEKRARLVFVLSSSF